MLCYKCSFIDDTSQNLQIVPQAGLFQWLGLVETSSKLFKNACLNCKNMLVSRKFGQPMLRSTAPEPMEAVRAEYLRLRKLQQQEGTS